jgi:hypothetical protein
MGAPTNWAFTGAVLAFVFSVPWPEDIAAIDRRPALHNKASRSMAVQERGVQLSFGLRICDRSLFVALQMNFEKR